MIEPKEIKLQNIRVGDRANLFILSIECRVVEIGDTHSLVELKVPNTGLRPIESQQIPSIYDPQPQPKET